MPHATRAARVSDPACGVGGDVSVGLVREKRGAGLGWSMPSRTTYVSRALRCGCSAASLIGMTPATHASVPSKTATHSAWVRLRNRSAISARSSSARSGSKRSGASSAMPSRSTNRS